MLELKGVTFRYPGGAEYRFEMVALPGEVTAVSGASGAGKSTLLDLIAGFLAAMSGTIRLDGIDLVLLPPERRPMSILFQSQTLFEHLNAGENLRLGLPARLPRREAAARIGAALAEVGLPHIADQAARTLSGGQKQRVALARTLLRDNPVLLLDEPFSGLDDTSRSEVRDLVARLTTQRKWHTILVTHHEDDIVALAARRHQIRAGRLES